MKIREFEINDIEKVQEIHQKYFADLEFPDFFNGFLCSFSITDDSDEIILSGGVRLIAESTLLTNKQFTPSVRIKALLEALQISAYVCRNTNKSLNQLHAFVSDDIWSKQLQLHGFRLVKSQTLVMDI